MKDKANGRIAVGAQVIVSRNNADVVAVPASDNACRMTGQAVGVDAGMVRW